jgi:hypothetical protein
LRSTPGGPLTDTTWHPDRTMLGEVGGAGVYLLKYLP